MTSDPPYHPSQLELSVWFPYGYEMDHITHVPGTSYQLPHEYYIFFSTAGVNIKGWKYGSPTNMTIAEKYKKQWRGNIVVAGTGSRGRKQMVHIKEGDITDVVIGMYVHMIQALCIKVFGPAKTTYLYLGGWKGTSIDMGMLDLEAQLSNKVQHI
jgi:hypothetical protein